MIDMSWQDASFLQLESPTTPMHVTYLLMFVRPDNAPTDFVSQLEQLLLKHKVDAAPFNYRLKKGSFLGPRPKWQALNNVSLRQHFSRTVLPAPGGERELGEYVSQFHSQGLDLSQPLWQISLIDGLDQNRFALCIKMHHAMADGLRLLRIVNRCLSADPEQLLSPPWATSLNNSSTDFSNTEEWRDFFFGIIKKDEPDSDQEKYAFPKPPNSALNGAITGARRVATQSLSLSRVKALAKASDSSLNDVVIALCGKVLRQHLLDQDALPEQSLVAGIPVALSNNDDREYGNALGGMTIKIGTDIEADGERLNNIHTATQLGKQFVHKLPNALNQTLSVVSTYVTKAKVLFKQDLDKAAPLSNLAISNLPGSREQLYLHGAALQSIYPASVLMPDQRLTIMLISYLDELNFGFVGCPDHLPHMQKIAESLSIALGELEQAFDL